MGKMKELAKKCAKKYEEALYKGKISPDDVVIVKGIDVEIVAETFQEFVNESKNKTINVREDGLYYKNDRITNYVPIPFARIKMRDRYNIKHNLVCVAIITKDLGDKKEIYVMKNDVFAKLGYEKKCCVRSKKELGGKLPEIIKDEYDYCKERDVDLRYGWRKDEYRAANGEEIGLTVEEAKDVIDKIEWLNEFPKSIAYPLLGFVFLSICKSKIQKKVDISDICLAYKNDADTYKMVKFFLHIKFLHNKNIYKFDYRELGYIADHIYQDETVQKISAKLLGNKKTYEDKSVDSRGKIEKNILSRLRDIPVLISNTNIKSRMDTLVKSANCGVIIEYDKVPPKNENMFILSNEYKAPDDNSKNKAEYLNFVKFIIDQFVEKTFKFEGKEMPFEEFWDNIEKVALKNECEQRAKIALLVGLCAVSCIMGSEINEELVKQYISDFSGKADNKFKKPKDTMKDTKEFIKNFIDFYDKHKNEEKYFTKKKTPKPEVGWIKANNNTIVLVRRCKEGKKEVLELEDWIYEYMDCNIKFEDIKVILKEHQVIDIELDKKSGKIHYKKKASEEGEKRTIHIKIDGARAFIEEKIPGNK